MRLRQDRDTTPGSVVKMRLPASDKGGFPSRPQLLDHPVRHFRAGGHSDVAGVHGFVFKGSGVSGSHYWSSPGRASNERQFHLSPDDCRRSDQAGKRGIVIWIEQAIHLGAAGLEPFGHLFSGDVFLAHGFGQQGRGLVDRRGIVSSSLSCFLLMLRGFGEKTAPRSSLRGPLPS